MKFTRDNPTANTIRHVSEGSLTVGTKTFDRTTAMTAEEILEDYDAPSIEELVEADFEILFDTAPEIVILGTGDRNLFPPRELVFAFARRGIGLEVMTTKAAARTFNVLAIEGRRVAALLYV